mmetsp:Transcript_20872/g.71976  ORF Transcript_20872/g.71976 Transcript_20872/m.71976 type:complete len:80 (-) Transcript_20872:617-856(-)
MNSTNDDGDPEASVAMVDASAEALKSWSVLRVSVSNTSPPDTPRRTTRPRLQELKSLVLDRLTFKRSSLAVATRNPVKP